MRLTITPYIFLVCVVSVQSILEPGPKHTYSFSNQDWYQHAGKIYNGGVEVSIRGINWFGLETTDRAPSGIWTSHQAGNITIGHSIAWWTQQIVALGFNALRIPISPQSLSNNPNVFPPASWATTWDPTLTTGWSILNSMLSNAQQYGLMVVIDYQTCNETQIDINLPGRPDNCTGYTINDWTDDLSQLALLSRGYPNVFAIDIFNEPHNISWAQWRDYALQGVKAVYSSNPQILSFVEGNDGLIPGDSIWTNWGENLYYASSNQVSPLGVPKERILYSAHVYGHGNPNWQECFGYMVDQGFTVLVGEFGYNSNSTTDSQFGTNFIQWIKNKGIRNWMYWAINANEGSNFGFVQSWDPTWCAIVGDKLNKMQVIGLSAAAYITSTNPPSLCNLSP